ncbi:MAG TPA: serine/threonine-protein kinase [Anaerolineales bacterium]|nr:serine/threonine-protein kinase [Anaerolineales bacterium]
MDTIQPGQMLGPYRIINQIGRGGMATVYKAYQPSVDRYVAIKVLPSQLAESREFATRFQQEARIIAKLEHPHILPVFDYGESDGIAYFVMRYMDAGTLKEKMIEGRPLPLSEIDTLFTQLAGALSYAHGHGVVHRDLKPANVLIDSQGNIFLTDFGIAKILESASPRLTQTDAIMGTPAYISPEQAQGQPVDQRSDIYSLGIILYEMVTGSVPFVAETPLAVLFKHISDPLPPPSVVKPDIRPAIEKVILKALAKDPRDRFSTAAEFVAAWERSLDTVEHVAALETVPPPRMTGAQAQPVPATKTSTKAGIPTVWLAGCLVGVCALFGLGGVALMASNLLDSSTPTAPAPTPTGIFDPPRTSVPQPTVTVPVINTGEILLEDDFSDDSIWGTINDTESTVGYENNTLNMRIFRENWVIWTTPNDENYRNVHMEVTVTKNDSDPTTAFGFICAQQPKDWSFYYLAATPAGQYAIIKATDGESDVILTGDGSWEFSDSITENMASYRVSADCGNGRLTLYVDGQQIASVTDSTYGTGRVGLFAWSGDKTSSANVNFDDFLLTSLE